MNIDSFFVLVELICISLPDEFAHRTLQYIGKLINSSSHIEFYLKWSNVLLTQLGQKENVLTHPTLLTLQQALNHKYDLLSKM